MTTLEEHTGYCITHWRDRVACLALADRMQEEKQLTRWQALRTVGQIRMKWRRAHELVLASRFFRMEGQYVALCQLRVYRALGNPNDTTSSMLLCTGIRSPRYGSVSSYPPGSMPDHRFILIGARWLIAELRDALRFNARMKWLVHHEKVNPRNAARRRALHRRQMPLHYSN